jgi:hypothetical protein
MFGFVSSYLDIGELMSPRDEGLGARLRALPLFDPPAGGWPSLERRRRHRAMRATTGWAMAASVLLAVIVGGWQFRAGPGDGAASTTVALLESQSRALEQTLQQARKQTVVWDGERAQRSAELESQVALVDLQIGYADAKSADELWRDRLSLMTALVETHSSDSAASDDGDLVEY